MENQSSIRSLKGVGEKTGALFEKLGIYTVEDLLGDYPRDYRSYPVPVPIGEIQPGEGTWAVSGVLAKDASVRRFKNIQITAVSFKDDTGSLQLTWFNMPFLRNLLRAGTRHVFCGKAVRKNGRLTMEQPEIYTPEQYPEMMKTLQPVYSQTRGLSNKTIVRAMEQALQQRQMEREYLPASLRARYQLAEYNFALEHIHFPADRQDLLFARKRLVFDEFFLFLLAVRRLKEGRDQEQSPFVIHPTAETEDLQSHLPYQLTEAQNRTLSEIFADMGSGKVMNRLVQGDVGSGKTILAVLALLAAAGCGYQGAFMAPTEVLARQHYESITRLFAEHGIQRPVVLLTGSLTAAKRREAYRQIQSHEAQVIVGTHALIQEKVVYDQLALVITDEQHRFVVGQRESLGNKGSRPHVLVMSATPIPRTLAIILYGDLDISVVDQVPASRLPIKNCVVGTGYRQKAYEFIAAQAAKGRQAYVICPMVEPSELMDAENVLEYSRKLQKALPGVTVGMLHGRMKPKEKNRVMEAFTAGSIQVLVSTTVIEVGVNVPNATVMMIENAERFGLAQLHQLRGRVGRGAHQSYCIMVNCGDPDGAQKRLEILNHSNDGFYIASQDLKLRGPGDMFGVRQSGEMEFKLADIFTDASLLKSVSEETDRLLDQDPRLEAEEHQELKRRLYRYLKRSLDHLSL